MKLSRDQLTVVVLALGLVASAAFISPGMLFDTSGPSGDAKSGDVYYTTNSPREDTGPQRGVEAVDLHAVPDDYTSSSTPSAKEPPDVRASSGAQTMQVTVTQEGGDVALRLEDDRVHDGRWVSIPKQWFESELGRVPSVAYIQHSSGRKYQSQTHTKGDSVAFYVEEFSTNTVSFSGSVEIVGNYTNGSQVQYDINDLDDASNVSVNMTGVTVSEWDNETTSAVGVTDSISTSPAGNAMPVGPSGGDPLVTVTAGSGPISYNPFYDEGDGARDFKPYFLGDYSGAISAEIQIQPDYNGTLESLNISTPGTYGTEYDFTVDVYIVQEGADATYGEGTLIADNWAPVWGASTQSVALDTNPSLTKGETYTLEFITNSASSGSDYIRIGLDDSASNTWFTQNGNTRQTYANANVNTSVDINSLDVSDGQGHSASLGDLNASESASARLNLSEDATSLSWDGSGTGTFDVDLDMKERTKTKDVSVELNTQSVSETGTLNDSETVSKTLDQSVLEEGTNTVNISVGTGTLSADAPEPKVGINVTHDATDKQSVDYDGGQWSESYNVSDTYASDRAQANLTIPFQADVYAIQNLEAEVNDSGWTTVDSGNYDLSSTTLTVDLDEVYGGDIPAGTTMKVRTTGIAVDPVNSSITVTKVTPPGEQLNSTVSLDSWGADSKLDVSSTARGDRVHYVTNETWDNEDAYVHFESGGTQALFLDAATSGDTLQVHTLPLTITPQSGDVNVRVPDDRVNRTQPVYKVTPGDRTGDAYDVTFVNASDGEDYILWSETNEVVIDSGTASSPLTLTDDEDNTALIQFLLDDGSSSSSGGDGGGGGVPAAMPTTGGDTNFIPLLGVALVGGLVLVAARNEGAVTDAGETAASSIESSLGRIPIAGPAVGKTIAGGVQTVTRLAEGIAGNRTVALSIVTALLVGAVQGGIIEVPQSSLTLIVVAGIGIYSLVALREFGEFTTERWAAILAATTLVTLQTLSEGSLLTAIVESRVWPILALAAVYLAYQLIQGIQQPDNPTNVVVEASTGEDDNS